MTSVVIFLTVKLLFFLFQKTESILEKKTTFLGGFWDSANQSVRIGALPQELKFRLTFQNAHSKNYRKTATFRTFYYFK